MIIKLKRHQRSIYIYFKLRIFLFKGKRKTDHGEVENELEELNDFIIRVEGMEWS